MQLARLTTPVFTLCCADTTGPLQHQEREGVQLPQEEAEQQEQVPVPTMAAAGAVGSSSLRHGGPLASTGLPSALQLPQTHGVQQDQAAPGVGLQTSEQQQRQQYALPGMQLQFQQFQPAGPPQQQERLTSPQDLHMQGLENPQPLLHSHEHQGEQHKGNDVQQGKAPGDNQAGLQQQGDQLCYSMHREDAEVQYQPPPQMHRQWLQPPTNQAHDMGGFQQQQQQQQRISGLFKRPSTVQQQQQPVLPMPTRMQLPRRPPAPAAAAAADGGGGGGAAAVLEVDQDPAVELAGNGLAALSSREGLASSAVGAVGFEDSLGELERHAVVNGTGTALQRQKQQHHHHQQQQQLQNQQQQQQVQNQQQQHLQKQQQQQQQQQPVLPMPNRMQLPPRPPAPAAAAGGGGGGGCMGAAAVLEVSQDPAIELAGDGLAALSSREGLASSAVGAVGFEDSLGELGRQAVVTGMGAALQSRSADQRQQQQQHHHQQQQQQLQNQQQQQQQPQPLLPKPNMMQLPPRPPATAAADGGGGGCMGAAALMVIADAHPF